MLRDVQKARIERTSLVNDKDPSTGETKLDNKGAIEQLSKTIDDRMRTLAEFHGHAAAGLEGDPTDISQKALDYHVREARKAKVQKEGLTNYASQMDMANAQTGERKEESLKRAKEIADSQDLIDSTGNLISGGRCAQR